MLHGIITTAPRRSLPASHMPASQPAEDVIECHIPVIHYTGSNRHSDDVAYTTFSRKPTLSKFSYHLHQSISAFSPQPWVYPISTKPINGFMAMEHRNMQTGMWNDEDIILYCFVWAIVKRHDLFVALSMNKQSTHYNHRTSWQTLGVLRRHLFLGVRINGVSRPQVFARGRLRP